MQISVREEESLNDHPVQKKSAEKNQNTNNTHVHLVRVGKYLRVGQHYITALIAVLLVDTFPPLRSRYHKTEHKEATSATRPQPLQPLDQTRTRRTPP